MLAIVMRRIKNDDDRQGITYSHNVKDNESDGWTPITGINGRKILKLSFFE
jgi:hypothetical protein